MRVSEAEFMALIAMVRAQGFAESCQASTPGLSAVAVATISPTSDSPIALGRRPIHRIREKRPQILSELLHLKSELDARVQSRKS